MQTYGEPENLDEVLNDLITQLQKIQMPQGQPLDLPWADVVDVTISPKNVCLVVSSFEGIYLNSGIGTAYYGLAELLARNGHNVTVLYTRDAPASSGSFSDWVARYEADNIHLKFLPPSAKRITNPKLQTTSYLVYQYLKTNSFNTVHFADFEGLGYYTTLAKRAGLAFEDTILIAGLHGPTSWILQANTGRSPAHESELEVDYMERHSVEFADYVWTPSNYLASWLSIQGWNLSSNVELLPLPPGPGIKISPNSEAIKAKELVFFGRLEKRKGLILFCDAVDILAKMSSILPADFSITFLGSRGFVDGHDSVNYVKTRSSSWPFPVKIATDFTRASAIEYLAEEGANRLPIIPSLVDNAPYTVFECLYANLPFLASATPSIIPLLSNATSQDIHLFETKPHHLASRMINALKTGVAPAYAEYTAQRAELAWLSFYNTISTTSVAAVAEVETPLVSVCITHFNRPNLVRQALHSIESQDYQNYEIILVDDGSNDTAAIRYLDSVEPYFNEKGWKLIRTVNRYLGAARNTAAQSAQGKYLLFLDDDNVAYPNQISSYVKVAEKTDAHIITAAHSVFRGTNPPTAEKIERSWVPLGDSLAVGLFKNCFGDANFFVEKDTFTALGGFTEEYGVGLEEHEFFAKAVFAGHKLTVVPEPLLYYRMHDELTQMIFTTDVRQGEARRMRPYIQAMTTEQKIDVDSVETVDRTRRSVVSLVARNAVQTRSDCNATVTSISPSQGPVSGGTYVTIYGSGYNCQVQSVTIDGLECTGVHVVSDTQLTCTTPVGTRSYVAVDVSVTISGNSVVLYSAFTYTPLGAPQLMQCIVTDDGLAVDCVFSVATNKDTCSSMFSAATIAKLGEGWNCVWINSTTVEITFGTEATLVFTDNVVVAANTVTSLGQGGVANEEAIVLLSRPFNPVVPVITIATPSTVGACEGIKLDASSSAGKAGRAFTVAWSLASPAAASVSDTLGSSSSLIVELPEKSVTVGTSYVFALTLTNWLEKESSTSATVAKSSGSVPKVTIAGSSLVQILKSSVLSLSGSAAASCGSSLGTVSYAWTVSPSVTVDATLLSSSSLSVPANTLSAGTTYVFTLTATDAASELSNSANVTVVVGMATLLAKIVGGNQQYAQPEIVSLDASSSSDPDNIAPVTFSWSCAKFNEPETPCSGITLPSTAMFTSTAADIGVGKWTFTVTVSGSNDRTASASAWVEVTEAVIISVAIEDVASPVNPGSALTLKGVLNSKSVAISDITWSWTLVSGSISDPSTAYTTPTSAQSLVIAPNVLSAAAQYEYKLTATHTSGASGFATVSFTVDKAPTLNFACNSISGQPETDSYTYDFSSTSGVSFLLSFIPSGMKLQIPLADLTTQSSISTLLPAGKYTLVGSTFSSSGVATRKTCDVSVSFSDASSGIAKLTSSAAASTITLFDIARISYSAKATYNSASNKDSLNLETLFTELLSSLQSLSSTASGQSVVAATSSLYVIADPSLLELEESDISSVITTFSELLDKQAGTTDANLLELDVKILSQILAQIQVVSGSSSSSARAKRTLLETTDAASLYAQVSSLIVKVSKLAGSSMVSGQAPMEITTDNLELTIFKQLASSADSAGVSIGPNAVLDMPSGFVPSSVAASDSLMFLFARQSANSFSAPSGLSFASQVATFNMYDGSSNDVQMETFDPAVKMTIPNSKLSETNNVDCYRLVDNEWTTEGAVTNSESNAVTCEFSSVGTAYAVMSSGVDGAASPNSDNGGLAGKYVAAIVVGGVGCVAAIGLAVFGVRKYKARPARPAVAAAPQDPAAGAPAPADAAVSIDAIVPVIVGDAAGSAPNETLPGGLSSYSSRSYSSSYATSSSSSEEEIMEAEIKNIVGELTHALPKDARALEVLGDKLEME